MELLSYNDQEPELLPVSAADEGGEPNPDYWPLFTSEEEAPEGSPLPRPRKVPHCETCKEIEEAFQIRRAA